MDPFDWTEFADEMAARETRGMRQLTFTEWCDSIAEVIEEREERERRRFAATGTEEDDDVCLRF